jgi:glycosyltransferase involved in cell wall biosynthesis
VGIVVPFRDPDAAAAAVIALNGDEDGRLRMGRNGIAAVRSEHNWADDAPVFVAAIEEAARRSSRGRASSRLRRPQ